MMRRFPRQDGSTLVGFAVVFPVLVSVIALALMADQAYEVKSDLQRTAQDAAHYAATRCDPRGSYPSGSACQSGATYPNSADVMAYVQSHFTGHHPSRTFVNSCSTTLDVNGAIFCETYSPAATTNPAPNQHLIVTLQYRFSSPIEPLMRLVPGGANAVHDLKVTGNAVVE